MILEVVAYKQLIRNAANCISENVAYHMVLLSGMICAWQIYCWPPSVIDRHISVWRWHVVARVNLGYVNDVIILTSIVVVVPVVFIIISITIVIIIIIIINSRSLANCVQQQPHNFYFFIFYLWPRFRTVQGQPRPKVMVPIDSPWVVSYSTSIDSIISFTIFKIFHVKFEIPVTLNLDGSRAYRVKVHSWIKSPWLVSHLTSTEFSIVSLTISRYLT